MKDSTDADYIHAITVCKDFEIKNLVEFLSHSFILLHRKILD